MQNLKRTVRHSRLASGRVLPVPLTMDHTCRILRAHTGPVRDVAVTPHGSLAISTGEDSTACLWDLSESTLRCKLTGHTSTSVACALSEDGRVAATASWDGSVRVWAAGHDHDSETDLGRMGQQVVELRQSSFRLASGCALSADGATLVAAFSNPQTGGKCDGIVLLYDVRTTAVKKSWLTDASLYRVVTSRDASVIASSWSGVLGKGVHVFDSSTGSALRRLPVTSEYWPTGLAMDAQATHVVIADDVSLRVCPTRGGDGDTNDILLPGYISDTNNFCDINADCSHVVAAVYDGKFCVWDLVSRTKVATLHGHVGISLGCAIANTPLRVVTGGTDNHVRVSTLRQLAESAAEVPLARLRRTAAAQEREHERREQEPQRLPDVVQERSRFDHREQQRQLLLATEQELDFRRQQEASEDLRGNRRILRGDMCPICLEEYRIGDELIQLPCHELHAGCMRQYASASETPQCPLDRQCLSFADIASYPTRLYGPAPKERQPSSQSRGTVRAHPAQLFREALGASNQGTLSLFHARRALRSGIELEQGPVSLTDDEIDDVLLDASMIRIRSDAFAAALQALRAPYGPQRHGMWRAYFQAAAAPDAFLCVQAAALLIMRLRREALDKDRARTLSLVQVQDIVKQHCYGDDGLISEDGFLRSARVALLYVPSQ